MALIAGHLYLVRKHGVAPITGRTKTCQPKHSTPPDRSRYRRHLHCLRHPLPPWPWRRGAPRTTGGPFRHHHTSPPRVVLPVPVQTLKLFRAPHRGVRGGGVTRSRVLARSWSPHRPAAVWSSHSTRYRLSLSCPAAIGWTGSPPPHSHYPPSGSGRRKSITPAPPSGATGAGGARRSRVVCQEKCADCHVIGREGTGSPRSHPHLHP